VLHPLRRRLGGADQRGHAGFAGVAVLSSIGTVAARTLDATRHEWEEGYRRLEAASGDRQRYLALLAELEVVLDQLRRRIGQTFTLDQLAAAYAGADRWVQDAIAEHDPAPGWPTRLTTVQDAAFHVYSRGAVDYRP
jgi:hypothetical protein